MKFMLMMNMPRGTGDYQINQWTPEAFNAHIQFMKDLNREIKKTGEFVEAQGLTPPNQAKIVRFGSGGPIVSDGPFAEAKELIGGYAVLELPSIDAAVEEAKRYAEILGGTLELEIRVVDEADAT